MEFTFDIWYFTVVAGQQEKEHEHHSLIGASLGEAVESARRLYRHVFAIYHGKDKVYPYK